MLALRANHRLKASLLSLAIVLAALIGYAGWHLFPSEATQQRAMTWVKGSGHYEIWTSDSLVVAFADTTWRCPAAWADRYPLVARSAGRLLIASDDSSRVARFVGVDVATYARQHADSINNVVAGLDHQLDELAYYRRSHSVLDEGYADIARYTAQAQRSHDSLAVVAQRLEAALKGGKRMQMRWVTRYEMPAGKTTKYGRGQVVDTLVSRHGHFLLLQMPESCQADTAASLAQRTLAPLLAERHRAIKPYVDPRMVADSTGVYRGELDSIRRPHGYGVYLSHSGTRYEGNWQHGLRQGFGFAIGSTGSLRVGDWKDDCYRGERPVYRGDRIYGIDISKYQHEIGRKRYSINWDKLRINHLGTISKKRVAGVVDYPVRFVYVKCTEGTTLANRYYPADSKAARKHGLHTGAYHFFSIRTKGSAQAAHFLKHVRKGATDLPPVLDVEPSAAQIRQMGGVAALWREVRTWLTTVERALGRKPVLYISQTFVNRYLVDAPDVKRSYDVWIARYGEYQPDVRMRMWQLCPDGRVTGIHGEVDLNVFNGHAADFETFVNQ